MFFYLILLLIDLSLSNSFMIINMRIIESINNQFLDRNETYIYYNKPSLIKCGLKINPNAVRERDHSFSWITPHGNITIFGNKSINDISYSFLDSNVKLLNLVRFRKDNKKEVVFIDLRKKNCSDYLNSLIVWNPSVNNTGNYLCRQTFRDTFTNKWKENIVYRIVHTTKPMVLKSSSTWRLAMPLKKNDEWFNPCSYYLIHDENIVKYLKKKLCATKYRFFKRCSIKLQKFECYDAVKNRINWLDNKMMVGEDRHYFKLGIINELFNLSIDTIDKWKTVSNLFFNIEWITHTYNESRNIKINHLDSIMKSIYPLFNFQSRFIYTKIPMEKEIEDQFVCQEGFTFNYNDPYYPKLCVSCQRGFYKVGFHNRRCTPCANGFTTKDLAAISKFQCHR